MTEDGRSRAWTDERRARLSAIHRKRFGAPEGYSTIYGVHVPYEFAEPYRYFAEALTWRFGPDEATAFVVDAQAADWANAFEIRQMWAQKMEIAEARQMIRQIQREALRANKNVG